MTALDTLMSSRTIDVESDDEVEPDVPEGKVCSGSKSSTFLPGKRSGLASVSAFSRSRSTMSIVLKV